MVLIPATGEGEFRAMAPAILPATVLVLAASPDSLVYSANRFGAECGRLQGQRCLLLIPIAPDFVPADRTEFLISCAGSRAACVFAREQSRGASYHKQQPSFRFAPAAMRTRLDRAEVEYQFVSVAPHGAGSETFRPAVLRDSGAQGRLMLFAVPPSATACRQVC